MCQNLFYYLLKEVFWHITCGVLTAPMRMLKYILEPQEVYEEKLRNNPSVLFLVPYYLLTQEMCDKAMHINPLLLVYVPDHFKRQEMCD